MTDNQNTHPSTMSEADKQALRDSDPAAFDDESSDAGDQETTAQAGGDTNHDKDAAAAVDAEAGADQGSAAGTETGDQTAGAADADTAVDAAGVEAAAAAAAEGETGKAPPALVPKERLNEVIDQRNQAERLSTQQAVELEQLRAKLAALEAPKDYEAAYEALNKRFDDGEIEEDEKARETRKLWREEQADIARRTALATQQETLEAAVQRSWEDEVAAFTQRNPGFLETAGNADVFQRALNSTAAFYGNTISQTELLNKAAKQAFEFTGYKPPSAAKVDPPAGSVVIDPATQRRAQNAARATDAGGTPPQIAGGVGERGGPNRGVDLDNLKPGTFSKKLSVEEQDKLLGGPGAA